VLFSWIRNLARAAAQKLPSSPVGLGISKDLQLSLPVAVCYADATYSCLPELPLLRDR
ncbi:hypothetical protein KUCAC02_035604, partial [Chaenocephalus aceratus]